MGFGPMANRILSAGGIYGTALINAEALIRATGGFRDPEGTNDASRLKAPPTHPARLR
jgi:hypothetical protein